MENKKISVSVGISCYNEEATIKQLLESILEQKQEDYVLKEIMVIIDGSTDRTREECQQVKDKRIKIIDDAKQLGKAARLNQLCHTLQGNVFVLFDADIEIHSASTINHLIQPFLENNHIGLVGGNPHPKKGKTFIEKGVNLTYEAYAPLRNIRNGSNPYGCDGKIMAASKKLAKIVDIPANIVGSDSYLYLFCKSKGYEFQHVPSAVVYYKSPSSLHDQIIQNTRFMKAEQLQKKIFGNLFDKEFYVPRTLFYSLLLKQFIKHPINALTIFLINKYCVYRAKKSLKNNILDGRWTRVSSTKG